MLDTFLHNFDLMHQIGAETDLILAQEKAEQSMRLCTRKLTKVASAMLVVSVFES